MDLAPGTVIVLGGNGAGKTNLLEAILYAACGRSFRTIRDAEMVRYGSDSFLLEAAVDPGSGAVRRAVGFTAGEGAQVRPGGQDKWLAPGSVLCFSPDDLQLVKGPPAVRRRFLDEALSRRSADYHRLALDYQKVLAQRNNFLKRARAGLLPLADIVPWDRQLAQLALGISRARQRFCERLSPLFAAAVALISGEEAGAAAAYRSQLPALAATGDPEAAVLAALAEAWPRDMERLTTSVGAHRDDVDFLLGERNLRQYGSQGEQRTAVLALLLADRGLGEDLGGAQPLLLLDDVMSELDPARRRRLMRALAAGLTVEAAAGCPGAAGEGAGGNSGGRVIAPGETYAAATGTPPPRGQVIITAADPSLFSAEELDSSWVIEIKSGAVARQGMM